MEACRNRRRDAGDEPEFDMIFLLAALYPSLAAALMAA
jgi:hypothetical protein